MSEIRCKFIMPISKLGDYSEQHWAKIKKILTEAVIRSGIEPCPDMVSNDEINPGILSRIYNSIFSTPIVVCDVSGNNPNVLYELGLRVAFDMPIILIKDAKTNFNFDLNSFEFLIYPNNLTELDRFDRDYMGFVEKLSMRIHKMYGAYLENSLDISPLSKYIAPHLYIQVGRGTEYDISGKFEYICSRTSIGYGHGGLCEIKRIHSSRNLIEWELRGYRFWQKLSKEKPMDIFRKPIKWDTKKAVLFPNKTFIVDYHIETGTDNILGFIKGDIELFENTNIVNEFVGNYHQDAGEFVVKGDFHARRLSDQPGSIKSIENRTLYLKEEFLKDIEH